MRSYGYPNSPRHRRGSLVAVGLAIALAGCSFDDLLEVEDPTVADPESVNTEEAVPTTLNAAIGAFQLAYSGAPGGGSYIESQITLSGILSDEFYISESFPTRIDVDQRATEFENGTQLATYARLQTARRLAEFSAAVHDRFDGTRNTTGHAHALNLAGFAYVLMAENYCSGVPFSTFDENNNIVYGAPLSTSEMLQHAISLFDEAAAMAAAAGAGAVDQLHLANLGKARAQLDLDDAAGAAATAQSVPTGFVYRIFHSTGTPRQNNGIWAANHNRRGVTVSDGEGGGLPYRSDADPRVRQLDSGNTGFDNTTPLFLQLKYPNQSADVILASGVEARLIEAEAQLRTGGAWLTTLNDLRDSPPAYYPVEDYPGIDTLAALADPGNADNRIDLLFTERARWLWLTAHRVGDLRRLMRQYGRSAAAAGWPTGSYVRGGVYGDHVSMLVPFTELNNPEFKAVFPDGCDPTIP